jgi:hypothetical protein
VEEPNDERPQAARKTLISLVAIYSINLVDRQILSVLIEEFTIVIGLLIFPNFFGSIHNGPSFAMVQSLSPVHMRAAASANPASGDGACATAAEV